MVQIQVRCSDYSEKLGENVKKGQNLVMLKKKSHENNSWIRSLIQISTKM